MNEHSFKKGELLVIREIKKAAVLGSGVMGSGIAALLANVGIETIVLDVVPNELTDEEKKSGKTLKDKSVRNRIAYEGIQKLLKTKPAPLTVEENIKRIEVGNFEDDLNRLQEVDWIIEAVVEKLEVKKEIFAQVDQYRTPGTIVSSNTSGLSIEAMAEGRSADFQQHFLGTHFFNPPRYLKLLELIPTSKTNTNVLSYMKRFGEDILGKGVVIAKDTPNFIANRIGVYGLLVTLKELLNKGLSVGEVDSITGPIIGRPKSATFRTLDVVGLDTLVHVAKTVYEQVEGAEKDVFRIPSFLEKMIEKGWLGSKTGQGFYKKSGKDIFELDPNTLEYHPRKKLTAPSIELAKQQKKIGKKVETIIYANDRAGQFLWNIIAPVLAYSAQLVGEIADDIVSIDRGMKWGFGWEQGPFELWDSIGLKKSVERMKEEKIPVPNWVLHMLHEGIPSFYKEENGDLFYYTNGKYEPVEEHPKTIHLTRIKKKRGVIKKNRGASLIDMGDGVALLEFHTKGNAIGFDILQMIHFAIDEVEKNYKGLVIGNEGKNFSVGANLGMILLEAQDDNLFELEMVVRKFQEAQMKIKYCKKPVVVAPHGMTLGGGAELALPAAHIQATTETYIGLVEVGVGVIPGGGGNKELYIKHLEQMPNGVEMDLQKIANKVFETIALAKVSTSAEEARKYNFLSKTDGISVNRDHQLHDAKEAVLALYEKGYKPPIRKKIPVVGETGYATLLLGAQSMYNSGYISAYDLEIGKKLAYVIAGGKVPFGTEVDEQYLLDLEREAFLSLLSNRKTHERMQHMLLKGKPLRN